MISSAPELAYQLTLPCSLGFLDPHALNVSEMPALLTEEATILPWKLAISCCHKHVIIILTLENQLWLVVPKDCHGLLRTFLPVIVGICEE